MLLAPHDAGKAASSYGCFFRCYN